MGVISFAQEYESPIDPGRLFRALIVDSHNLCPKLMSQSINSIEIIDGDGEVGSIKQINFSQGMQQILLFVFVFFARKLCYLPQNISIRS